MWHVRRSGFPPSQENEECVGEGLLPNVLPNTMLPSRRSGGRGVVVLAEELCPRGGAGDEGLLETRPCGGAGDEGLLETRPRGGAGDEGLLETRPRGGEEGQMSHKDIGLGDEGLPPRRQGQSSFRRFPSIVMRFSENGFQKT